MSVNFLAVLFCAIFVFLLIYLKIQINGGRVSTVEHVCICLFFSVAAVIVIGIPIIIVANIILQIIDI